LENAAEFMLAADQSTDGFSVRDLSGVYVFVNNSMARMIGREVDQIIGKTDADLYTKEESSLMAANFSRAITGEMVVSEHTRSINGASKHFLEVLVVRRSFEGQAVGVFTITRQISQLTSRPFDANIEFISEQMRYIYSKCLLWAPWKSTILLTGESGTGKDRLARYIHKHSSRSGKFLSTNCAELVESLFESEIFGHTKGAFTGAHQEKMGLLKKADGGTLFLNEIGDLAPQLQAKLLRFCDESQIRPVGDTEDFRVDVRIIAATNKDLDEMIQKGEFRKDLFYRLNALSLKLPPLRERSEDIPILVNTILGEIHSEMKLPSIPKVSDDAVIALKGYPWPGNIRELRHFLEYAVIESGGGNLRSDLIKQLLSNRMGSSLDKDPHQLMNNHVAHSANDSYQANSSKLPANLQDEQFNAMIKDVFGGSATPVGLVAETLGVSRKTISKRLKRLGLPEGETGRMSASERQRVKELLQAWLKNKNISITK
jgi:PAS domain S-box-containing protein